MGHFRPGGSGPHHPKPQLDTVTCLRLPGPCLLLDCFSVMLPAACAGGLGGAGAVCPSSSHSVAACMRKLLPFHHPLSPALGDIAVVCPGLRPFCHCAVALEGIVRTSPPPPPSSSSLGNMHGSTHLLPQHLRGGGLPGLHETRSKKTKTEMHMLGVRFSPSCRSLNSWP